MGRGLPRLTQLAVEQHQKRFSCLNSFLVTANCASLGKQHCGHSEKAEILGVGGVGAGP